MSHKKLYNLFHVQHFSTFLLPNQKFHNMKILAVSRNNSAHKNASKNFDRINFNCTINSICHQRWNRSIDDDSWAAGGRARKRGRRNRKRDKYRWVNEKVASVDDRGGSGVDNGFWEGWRERNQEKLSDWCKKIVCCSLFGFYIFNFSSLF